MQTNEKPAALLTDRDVEALLKVHRGWAAKNRLLGGGPGGGGCLIFIRLGRSIRYRLSDVMAFVDASARTSTSDASARDGAR